MALTLEQIEALTEEDVLRIAEETSQTVEQVRDALKRIAYRLAYDERGYVKARRTARNRKVWQLTKAVKRSI